MSKDTANIPEFEGLRKLPLAVLVTDKDGKVIYKNELAAKYFNIRKRRSILQIADETAKEIITKAFENGTNAIVPLRSSDIYGLSLVIPRKGENGEMQCIFSLVPYSYEFMEYQSEIIGKSSSFGEHLEDFERQINIINDALEKGEYDFSEAACSMMKINIMKLRRFETRLQARVAEDASRAFRTIDIAYDKSIELCTFVSSFINIFNVLAGVVGGNAVYVPMRGYCVCRANSMQLTKLLVYILMYCMKFSVGGESEIYIVEDSSGACISIVPKTGFIAGSVIAELDFCYLQSIARSQEHILEIGKTDDGRACINLRFPRRISSAASLSASGYIFDVSASYIEEIFREAFELLGGSEL